MSVHPDRTAWRVRYRDASGKQRSRTFARRSDAKTFDREMTRRLQLGPALAAELDRQTMTLGDYVAGPWRAHAATLSQPTRDKYAWALQKHLGELVDEPLIRLDAPAVAAHQRRLLDRGATASTVREVMAKLSGILQIATEHGHIPANAVRAVRNVPADHGDEIRPLAPVELEALIESLRGRDRAIALLGRHLGLRPLEIRQVRWDAFDGATLTIGRAQTKATARRSRVIAVPRVTARELRAWQLESGGRGSDPIVGKMTQNALKLWARRTLPKGVRLYDLRHSHASACHYAGLTLPEAARRLGHSHQTHILHYAHVIDAISGQRYDGLDALIDAARNDPMFRQCSASAEQG
jgi:integrase